MNESLLIELMLRLVASLVEIIAKALGKDAASPEEVGTKLKRIVAEVTALGDAILAVAPDNPYADEIRKALDELKALDAADLTVVETLAARMRTIASTLGLAISSARPDQLARAAWAVKQARADWARMDAADAEKATGNSAIAGLLLAGLLAFSLLAAGCGLLAPSRVTVETVSPASSEGPAAVCVEWPEGVRQERVLTYTSGTRVLSVAPMPASK